MCIRDSANAFNERVERIFVENNDLTTGGEIKLLEILAQSLSLIHISEPTRPY